MENEKIYITKEQLSEINSHYRKFRHIKEAIELLPWGGNIQGLEQIYQELDECQINMAHLHSQILIQNNLTKEDGEQPTDFTILVALYKEAKKNAL